MLEVIASLTRNLLAVLAFLLTDWDLLFRLVKTPTDKRISS